MTHHIQLNFQCLRKRRVHFQFYMKKKKDELLYYLKFKTNKHVRDWLSAEMIIMIDDGMKYNR